MSDSARLHVEQYGSGPALVLAHGFGGSARNFRPQARAFSASRSVWLYDARGHARSIAPSEASAYSEATLVADFDSVAERAKSAEAAPRGQEVVGGLSLGAYTALIWALHAPEPPRGLVLAAFPSGGNDGARSRWATGLADAIEQRGLDAGGAEYVWADASRFDPKGAALIRQGFLEHSAPAMTAILRNVLASLKTPDQLAPELERFERPTLIVVGGLDLDALTPSRRLAELLPNAKLVVIPDAGHVVNLAAPVAFNAALEEFLATIRS